MIIRAEEQEQLKGHAIRDGVGDAFSRLLVKNRMKVQSSIVAIAHNRLPAGSSWGKRVQHNTEEIFYVLEGKATVDYEGETAVLAPGDLVLCDHGKSVSLSNQEGEELLFLGIMLAQPKALKQGFLTTGSAPYSRL